jgi:hypothetical protein
VRDIACRGRDDLGTLELSFTDDRVRVTEGVTTRTYAELIVDGAELAARLERTKADLTSYGTPMRHVTIVRDARDPSRFYVRVALLTAATSSIRRDHNVVRWHFQSNGLP